MPFYPLLIKQNWIPCQSSRNSSCENGTHSAFCICCWGFGRPVRERCDLAPLCFGPLCVRRSRKHSWHLVGQSQCCFASLNLSCLRAGPAELAGVGACHWVQGSLGHMESSEETRKENPVTKDWFQGGSRLGLRFCVASLLMSLFLEGRILLNSLLGVQGTAQMCYI